MLCPQAISTITGSHPRNVDLGFMRCAVTSVLYKVAQAATCFENGEMIVCDNDPH